MKIALISTARGWYGGEQQVWLLACGLRDRGHEVLLLGRQGTVVAERFVAAGFDVTEFPGRGRNLSAGWTIRRALQRFAPDVLHMNDSHGLKAGAPAAGGLRIGARIASRRVAFPMRSPWLYRRFTDNVIAVSHHVAAMCWQAGINRRRISVVHDGVDPQRIVHGCRNRGRSRMDVTPEDPVVLSVASLTENKGHRSLLQAMACLMRKRPRLRLVLAGDGPLAEPLQIQARKLGIDSRVRFLGYESEVADLLAASDVFVMNSNQEGLCSSLIDAMLARRPIVAAAIDGAVDLIGSGENREPVAWTFPPGDEYGLAQCLQMALAASEREVQARTGRAYRRALEGFTADHMVESTLQVYQCPLHDTMTARRQNWTTIRNYTGTRAPRELAIPGMLGTLRSPPIGTQV